MPTPDPRRQGPDDPYVGANFSVELEFDAVVVAGFSEVSGLEMELEIERYEEGGVNTHVHQLPTRFTYPNLTLRRGVSDSQRLLSWIQEGLYGPVERKTVGVLLQNWQGVETWRWTFLDAYPVRWTGPDLSATDGSVAIESLELAHNGLVLGE